MFLLSLTMAVASALAPVTFHDGRGTDARLRLGDIADLSALPASLRPKAASLVLMNGRPGSEARLVVRDLQARATALMPVLAPWMGGEAQGSVQARFPAVAERPATGACVRVVQPVAAGAVLLTSDLQPAICAGATPDRRALAVAPNGLARTTRALQVGEVLAEPPAGVLATVRPGQTLTVAVTVGPVRVERRVQALQSARAGEAVFVRAGKGEPYAAWLPEVAP